MTERRHPQAIKESAWYEIVQLLRVNGMQVHREGQSYIIRKGGAGAWTDRKMSRTEFNRHFGCDTEAYKILRMHPRAASIPVTKPKTESLA